MDAGRMRHLPDPRAAAPPDRAGGPRVLVWGTADLGKPRVRILLAALEAAGAEVCVAREPVWDGVEDKSQLRGPLAKVAFVARYIGALGRLRRRLRDAPPHDVVLICYLGLFDVLAYRWFAGRRAKPVVWDAFMSLYDTVVEDRRLVGARHPAAWVLRRLEAAAARAADWIVLDTGPHAARFAELFGRPGRSPAAIPVGAEPIFAPLRPKPRTGPFTVLFYGQFIPLHGADTIIEAARRAKARGWRWRIIGTGQEAPRLRAALAASPVEGLDWCDWVPYDSLPTQIAAADVCLGIFGESPKAASVVPNKAYQVLASGRPLVTRRSPAMSELVPVPVAGIETVPPSDPEALLDALVRVEAMLPAGGFEPGPDYRAVRDRFSTRAIGMRWVELLQRAATESWRSGERVDPDG